MSTHVVAENPGLISTHSVASDEFDRALGTGGVEAVVVGHHLLTLCVRKDL